jgi:hypothetical protein
MSSPEIEHLRRGASDYRKFRKHEPRPRHRWVARPFSSPGAPALKVLQQEDAVREFGKGSNF